MNKNTEYWNNFDAFEASNVGFNLETKICSPKFYFNLLFKETIIQYHISYFKIEHAVILWNILHLLLRI